MRMKVVLLLAVYAGAAEADPCDVQTAEIVEATGARFDHRSPSGQNVFLAHPLAHEFVMTCRDNVVVGPGHVALSFDGAYPPAGYFDLVAKAGASSLRVPAAEIRHLAVQSHKKALAADDENAEVSSTSVYVECQSFRRDGGGALTTVWPPRKE